MGVWAKRAVLAAAFLVGGLGVLLAAAKLALDTPLPPGQPGPAADAMAQRMMQAVGAQHWADTGAVQWTFSQRNTHLWDLQRGLNRVQHGKNTVWVDLARLVCLVGAEDGQTSPGTDAQCQAAYAAWANDSFWMMGPAKVMDAGTHRELSRLKDGTVALKITFSSGGVTPGDSYVWVPGPTGLPVAWRMWVSVLPVGGLEVSWEGWQRLATGVWVATDHHVLGLARPTLSDVQAAATLSALVPGPDPFEALVAARH